MFNARTRASIVKRYERGESSTSIAEHYGCAVNTILRVLREEGVTIRRRGPVASK